MDDRIPGLLFGLFLICLGAGMLAYQLRAAQPSRDDLRLEPHDRRFLHRRSRRRIQVAGLILLIGIMIPVGDALIPWQESIGTFGVYWLIVIGLALWTMLLGVGDLLATQVHSQVSLERLQAERKHLEETVDRLRQSERGKQTTKGESPSGKGPTLE
ncbi:MAG: hypothetical protein KDA58_06220 [Planctomycetaceae bacterium]|nr:hypothetical protein [Planctomycetaceae bacterium]